MPYKKLHIEIRNGVGYIFMGSGSRFNKLTINTLRELKRAVNLAKDDPVLYDHLGDAYMKSGLLQEAIEAWERSLKVDPEGPTAASVKKKIEDAHDTQRGKGAPKAQQQK